MKNTDYKDVFDVGDEALSMDNKFSFPTFNNSFTIGENIRGMSNVSPLATVKLFNQSAEDLQNKYYPDGNPPVDGTFTYIPDYRSDLTPIIKTTVKDFYYYGVEDIKNFAFKVIIFSSTEATKLKECFEISNPKGREILIFVEDNAKDSVSGTYGAMKISEDVLSFLNSKKRLAYDVYDNTEIYKEVKAVVPELTDDQIKSLLTNGYIEDFRINAAKTYFKVASFFSSGISLIHPSLGILTNDALRATTSTVLEKIIVFIESARLEENRWQPKPPRLENGEIDGSYKYNPLLSSGKNDSGTINFTEISRYLKAMLTEQNNFVKSLLNIKKDFKHDSQPKGLLEILYKSYLDAYYIMHDVASNLENISDLEILKYGTKVYNALLCGIWNGLVDAASGLFAMVKMIYDGITLGKDFAQNIEQYLPILLEQFDEVIQAVKNIDFTEIAKYIYGKLKEITLTFDPVACGYFIGYAYGFIISLIIEIVVGTLVSGGTLDIPIIIQKLEEVIFGIFRLGWGALKGATKAIRTFSKFIVKSIQDLIHGLQELINFLKNGGPEIKNLIDDVLKAIQNYSKDTRGSLNVQIPLLGPAELKLYKNLVIAFFKPFRKLLLHYMDNLLVIEKWKSLNPMKNLDKITIEELLEIRKLNKQAFNKNAAIMIAELEVDGKIMVLEYKALAGKSVNGIGLCSNVDQVYIAKQLGMSVDELMTHYKTIDELEEVTRRFHDSEHKIFSVFDDEILKLKANFGENKVKVKSLNIKTLYEPCNSCKKQIIIRHEMYGNPKIKIEAVHLEQGKFALGNNDLIDYKIIK
ncbi:hypothetical protein EGI16_15675 [Chryseobacterium sp. G0240]|uniref:hypothetical protein n=1 Tax=Chryseobacterium sp. G0240 TaxID=2487066 RepID=UPI000F446A81|nr:hypothetical protein [Chryseobacterium sp. G0240]ROI02309.1 hypothetical protein EGI16_15675 [Chryseobacterium sp. G0240]